jgi:hypothetical protein
VEEVNRECKKDGTRREEGNKRWRVKELEGGGKEVLKKGRRT